MAQFKHYFEVGQYTELKPGLEEKIKSIADAFTPTDTNELVIELYRHRFIAMTNPEGSFAARRDLSFGDVSAMLASVAKDVQFSVKRVQGILKSKGYAKSTNVGVGP